MSAGEPAVVRADFGGPRPGISRSARDIARRRWSGQFEVDPWGLDGDLVELVDPVLRLRWDLSLEGAEPPERGPAVVVCNSRFGLSEPLVVATALRHHTGQAVRFTGAPDDALLGPTVRRLGGVMPRTDELAGLLRAGHMVVVPLGRNLRSRRRAGHLVVGALAPALAERVPVVPVAAIGREVGRHWRVVVGERLHLPPGRSPLAVAELADEARRGVQHLLDERFPPRWPFG